MLCVCTSDTLSQTGTCTEKEGRERRGDGGKGRKEKGAKQQKLKQHQQLATYTTATSAVFLWVVACCVVRVCIWDLLLLLMVMRCRRCRLLKEIMNLRCARDVSGKRPQHTLVCNLERNGRGDKRRKRRKCVVGCVFAGFFSVSTNFSPGEIDLVLFHFSARCV